MAVSHSSLDSSQNFLPVFCPGELQLLQARVSFSTHAGASLNPLTRQEVKFYLFVLWFKFGDWLTVPLLKPVLAHGCGSKHRGGIVCQSGCCCCCAPRGGRQNPEVSRHLFGHFAPPLRCLLRLRDDRNAGVHQAEPGESVAPLTPPSPPPPLHFVFMAACEITMRTATYCTRVCANKATAAINLLYLPGQSVKVLLNGFSPPTFIATLVFFSSSKIFFLFLILNLFLSEIQTLEFCAKCLFSLLSAI